MLFIIIVNILQSGTALTDVSIGGTDPEGTTVSVSLNCGADAGYLTIDATSGIVTMATAYDLETVGVNTYTLTCDVIGTDAAGQSATSTLNVIVTDGNDVNPVFASSSYSFYINEGKS